MERTGTSAVIIGNEVLSAKVRDENGVWLLQKLSQHGVPVRWMAVVPDEIDAIVEALLLARRKARTVVTSGGIGPTHDDVTIRAVALSLGRSVVRLPQLEALVRQHHDGEPPPAAWRMAEVPEGAELLFHSSLWYPVLVCDGIYLLPGIPSLFRSQLEVVLPRLEARPLSLRCVYLGCSESEIAGVLDAVALALPQVQIGSYPTYSNDLGYKVKITIEHPEPEQVEQAAMRLLAALPAGTVIRTDP